MHADIIPETPEIAEITADFNQFVLWAHESFLQTPKSFEKFISNIFWGFRIMVFLVLQISWQ